MNNNIPSPSNTASKQRTLTGLANANHSALISAVDSMSETNGAGIVLIDANGGKTEIRGGPRRKWVWIAPKGFTPPPALGEMDEAPTPTGFWDRWGNEASAALSCSSAVASGIVIGLSGGTATLAVGAFAMNSAFLCGTSVGKLIAADAWKEFEKDGGALYRTWLTAETLLSLIDLCNGVKGAATALRAWKQCGKLARLEKVVAGRKLTRANLLNLIRETDPSLVADLQLNNGANYVSRGKLIKLGRNVLNEAKFISLNNQRARVISDTIGNALSLAGARENFQSAKRTYDVWLIAME